MSANGGDRVSVKTALAYSSLTVPITAVGIPVGVYLPPLYATEIGLGLAQVGMIFMLARIWDVVTDPIMGILIDRFPSRWGRRKHWIVLGVPLLAIPAWFVYLPSREPHSALYLFSGLFVLYIGFTLIDTAHKSWASDIATTYDDRSRLFGYREAINLVGSITVLTLPAILDRVSNPDAFDKAASMGLFLIVLLPITALIIVTVVPDRIVQNSQPKLTPKALIAAIKNRVIIRILLAESFVAIGVGALGAMFLFIAKWIFELGSYGSLGLIVLFLAGMIAVPVWVRLGHKWSKHTALIAATFYSIAVTLLYLVVEKTGSLTAFIGLSAAVGLGFTAPQILIRSMVADAVDHEELRSGENRSGLYFALMSTAYKLGNALSVGIAYLTLDYIGFDPAQANSDAAITGLLVTFVTLICIAALLTVVCMWRYPLTRQRHEAIRAELTQRTVSVPA